MSWRWLLFSMVLNLLVIVPLFSAWLQAKPPRQRPPVRPRVEVRLVKPRPKEIPKPRPSVTPKPKPVVRVTPKPVARVTPKPAPKPKP
ncbi:energy transducer TonB, partial [bacterium CPR1]|nr:energy transducer TonB [bacterium CPR1]